MVTTLVQTLEAFLSSDDFSEALEKSTRASWGGSGYSVELFEDGDWRVLWNNEIGNRYNSPGVILRVPPLDDNDWQDLVVDGGMEESEWFSLAVENERVDIANLLRESLKEMDYA